MTLKKRKTTLKLVSYIFLVLITGYGAYIWLNNHNGLNIIQNLRGEHGFLIIFLTVPIQVILSVTPFPSEPIAFTSSLILGFWLGSLNNWLAWVIAAYLEYNLARFGKKELDVDNKLEKRIPSWLRKFPVNSPKFLILGLWLPFGSHIVSVSAGISKVDPIKFMTYISIGYIPLSMVISGLANGIIRISPLWN